MPFFVLLCFPSRSLKVNDVLESNTEKVSEIAGDFSEPFLDDSLQEVDHVFLSFGLVIDSSHIEIHIQLVNLLIYSILSPLV